MDIINGVNISFLLFFIGVWGIVISEDVIKTIASLGIMQVGIILYFISENHIKGSIAPIVNDILDKNQYYSDPLPSALMITEIVIGAGVTAASLIMFIHLQKKYGTTNWSQIKKIRERDE